MSNIISLILAAGVGSRMGNDNLHKCLTPVKGKPFILHQMDALIKAYGYELREFNIVVGHLDHQIVEAIGGSKYRGVPVVYTYNDHYRDYGSGYSLLLGLDKIHKNHMYDSFYQLVITEADCLVKHTAYEDLRTSGVWSTCLVGKNIDKTKSVLVSSDLKAAGRHLIRDFSYDRSHVDVYLELQEGYEVLGESVQTWYFGEAAAKNYTNEGSALVEIMKDDHESLKSYSNLFLMNRMFERSKDINSDETLLMSPIYYNDVFINLNTTADVELAESLEWVGC